VPRNYSNLVYSAKSEKQRKTDYVLTQAQNSDTSLWLIKCYTNTYVNYTVLS